MTALEPPDRIRFVTTVALGAALMAVPLFAQRSFEIGGHSVGPGVKQALNLATETATVPVTVFNGRRPGPVLAITAGIHGDEYPPIIALQRLVGQIEPDQLAGTLVVVHLANLSGFQSRTIARSPIDGKNLNREFPGRADGTSTERLAHLLTTEIVARTDYLIDMHCGSANEKLLPHAYSPFIGDEALDLRTLEFAKAMGFRPIVLYGDRPRDPAHSVSYPNTATTRGKPAITLECGQLGQRDEACTQQLLFAATNALRFLKMLPGQARTMDDPVLYRKLHYAVSPASGLLYPLVTVGDKIQKGALLAYITDYFGKRSGEIHAPADGTVLSIFETPPVGKDEEAVTIAQ
jgi:predicted deacylase